MDSSVFMSPAASGFCQPLWSLQRNLTTVQYGERQPDDCQRGESGLLTVPTAANSTAFAASCTQRCMTCARCRFVSYSFELHMCAWYVHCDTDNDLRHFWSPIAARAHWHTARVRSAVPAALPPAVPAASTNLANRQINRPYRLAIATLSLLGGTRRGSVHLKQGCGMLGWCQGARRLKRALATASPYWSIELLVLAGPISAKWDRQNLPAPDMTDCAEARMVRADKRLQGAISGCLNTGRKRRGSSEWRHRVRRGIIHMPASLAGAQQESNERTLCHPALHIDLNTHAIPHP